MFLFAVLLLFFGPLHASVFNIPSSIFYVPFLIADFLVFTSLYPASPSGVLHFLVFLSYCHCLKAVFSASPSGALTSYSNSFLIADFPVLQQCSLDFYLGPDFLLCSLLIADYPVLQLCSLHFHLGSVSF